MRFFIITMIIIISSQVLNGCSEQGPQQTVLGAWLQYLPGNVQGEAVLRVTLFPKEHDQIMEKDVLQQLIRGGEKGDYSFKISSDKQPTMFQDVLFHEKTLQGERESEGVGELVFLYRIKSAKKPPPGSILTVNYSTPQLRFSSNSVKISTPAANMFYSLQREARVCVALEDVACLKKIGAAMLKGYPDRFPSYWFTALAFELSGNKIEALDILEKGLQYLPNPDDSTPASGHIDTSAAVFAKINALYGEK